MEADPLVIIVDDESQEPITATIQDELGCNKISVWPLSNLFCDVGIQFSYGEMVRNTITPPDRNLNISRIFDRVVEITPATARNIDSSGLTTVGMVSAAYQAVLNNFRYEISEHPQYSTVGRVVPLFSQWLYVKKFFPHLSIPDYAYGYGPEIVNFDHLDRAVHKSPFDLYSWIPNGPDKNMTNDHFVVSRPKGRPILSYCVGEEVSVVDLSNQKALHCEDIHILTRRVATIFGTKIGEILWFKEGPELTFASFSHKLFASSKTSDFRNRAQSVLSEMVRLSADWRVEA
ncbi:hypothetical protein [Novosphingobium beihaiensis]|uniref:Uncharacterized protein n=1 Tax=Novosphingobium beihaiensis TaxID=2930389 RepID=A0ABT0BVE7_9SPHN|nr:hypothetical protein [Novosphingobium beihaiensis]MCJ2189055.1 hypothetical protein [Novosphingobium beihaiensis]